MCPELASCTKLLVKSSVGGVFLLDRVYRVFMKKVPSSAGRPKPAIKPLFQATMAWIALKILILGSLRCMHA